MRLLPKMLDLIKPEAFEVALTNKRFSGDELESLYTEAQKASFGSLCSSLIECEEVAENFKFLENYFIKWKREKDYGKLALPLMRTKGYLFKRIIEDLTGEDCNRYVLKEFGKGLEQHGTVVLNNFYALKDIYPNVNIHQFFKVDHSKPISSIDRIFGMDFKVMFARFRVDKCVRLINSFSPRDSIEIFRMFHLLDYVDRKRLVDSMPRKKIKTSSDILQWLQKELGRQAPSETLLNQTALPLNGMSVEKFTLWVPKRVLDLQTAKNTLLNCLDSYPVRVLRGDCQIIGLLENNELKYAVELTRRSQDNWMVVNILGFKNDPFLQKYRGKHIRETINLLYHQHCLKNASNTEASGSMSRIDDSVQEILDRRFRRRGEENDNFPP